MYVISIDIVETSAISWRQVSFSLGIFFKPLSMGVPNSSTSRSS
jgi:hypothetical protein